VTHTVILHGEAQRQRAKALIDRAPPGYVVAIREPRRTTAQNDRLWAMLTDIATAKPEGRKHTPEVWKCLFMAALSHEVHFEMGLDGKPFPVGYQSSRLNKSQMADLLTFIEAWAAERGVIWKDEG
jgi:hypothetical protein